MQQTKQYKLNKPGMDDPFSTVPLNENADKVDGVLAALEQGLAEANRRQVFHKLLSAVPEEGTKELTIDLSDVDLTPYGAVLVLYSIYNAGNSTSVSVNGLSSLSLTNTSGGYSSSNHGGGFAVFVPAGDRIFGASLSSAASAQGTGGGARYGQFSVPWAEVSSMTFKLVSHQSTVVLYGIRF